jgi:hypothetical protein
MELKIQKNPTSPAPDRFHDRGTFGCEKLEPDFAECRRFLQCVKESHGTVRIGNIQGDDDFVLGSGGEFHTMRG